MLYKKGHICNLVITGTIALLLMMDFTLTSCGKANTTTAAGSNTRLLIVNASPDVLPIGVFINTVQLGGVTFKYPAPSKYYSIGSGNQLVQVRTSANFNFISQTDSLRTNTNYSLFIVGLASATVKADSLSYIFTADTSTIANQGRAKVKFINASPRTSGLDVYANGTLAFGNCAYKSVSNYLELPVGTYDFKISPHGTAATTLTDLPLITLQDGKLYTLFTHGLVGHTDTAALGATVILNQ